MNGQATCLPLAILGGGLIGRRHAALVAAHPGIRLTALVEPDAAKRSELTASGLPVVADIDDVPSETRAAIVATPNQLHEVTGLACAARGWSILMEKPIAHDIASADRLIAGCAKAGTALLVGHHRRHHSFVAEARTMLPLIGPPVAVQGLWCLRKPNAYFDVAWRKAEGGGPILINLIHDIDLLRYLIGEITDVGAISSNAARSGTVEDTVAIAISFTSGALGSFLLSDAAASPWGFEAACGENPGIGRTGQDALRIMGPKGALCFPSLTLWSNGANPDWSRPLTSDKPRPLHPTAPLVRQLDHLIEVTEGATPLVTGEDARATLAATLAVEEAARTGRTISLRISNSFERTAP